MQEIPLQVLPNQTVSTVLDGHDVELTFRQMGTRLFGTVVADGNTIAENAICLNFAAVNVYPDPDFSGALFFFDTEGDTPPQWEGLGQRYKLYYVSEGERGFKRMQMEAADNVANPR